jgi:hypothetical protein
LKSNPERAGPNKVISQLGFTGDQYRLRCGRAEAGLGATKVVQGCYGTG